LKQALIGVDIGTTNIKAVAFTPEGLQLAKSAISTQTHYPKPEWAQYEAHEIWAAICSCLQQLVKDLPNDVEPKAISFSSMAEAAVPLGDSNEPLHPIIAWFDRRVIPQLEWWSEHIGAEKTARITGLPPATSAGILRLLWLRDNEPRIYAQISSWLNMADYGAYKLCGAKYTDYSIASRMMVLDLNEKQWSSSLLSEIDVPKTIFGEPIASGVKIGEVHKAASEETGLPEGLTVCSGGHDHVCASLGLGITELGEVFDSMGTAEVIMTSTLKPVLEERVSKQGIAQGVHVIPDRYYAMSGLAYSGGSIDWIRQCLSALLSSSEEFDDFIALASQIPEGSDGVFFLPHLRQANPPIFDPSSKGAFIGLTSDTGAGHMARAVIEGVAYEYQRILETVLDTFSLSPAALVAAGGGTRNALFLDIKAKVSGLDIRIPEIDEAACLGAAVLAGVGSGLYKDFSDAKERIKYTSSVVASDPKSHQAYRHRYEAVFLKLYASLKEINRRIIS